MKVLRLRLIIYALATLTACVHFIPGGNMLQVGEIQESTRVFGYDLKTMALYGGYISGLTRIERIDECRDLIEAEADELDTIGIQLHFALVMMLTPECGGPSKALEIFGSSRSRIRDRGLAGLLKLQSELAKQLIAESEKGYLLEEEVNGLKIQNVKLKDQVKESETERAELRATLDALKKIEKTFHKRGEEGVQ